MSFLSFKIEKEKGSTRKDLAELIGVDRSYMGFIERGERSPTLEKIHKISKALDISLEKLFSNL